MMPPGSHNAEIEKDLEELPDKVAEALKDWRIKTLEREKIEAKLFLTFKSENGKRTAEEIKSMVRDNMERYKACLEEISAEIEHTRLNDKLLSAKKLAGLRTAY